MKKVVRILTSWVLCAAICLSVAACGGSDGSELQKYLDDNKSQIEQATSSMAQPGSTMTLEADGNTLVYKFQFTEDTGDKEETKAALETAVTALESTFQTMFEALKEEVSSVEAIRVTYIDKDGGEIYSKEFK